MKGPSNELRAQLTCLLEVHKEATCPCQFEYLFVAGDVSVKKVYDHLVAIIRDDSDNHWAWLCLSKANLTLVCRQGRVASGNWCRSNLRLVCREGCVRSENWCFPS